MGKRKRGIRETIKMKLLQEAQRPELQDQSVEKLRLEPRYIYLTVKSVPFQLPEAVQGGGMFFNGACE